MTARGACPRNALGHYFMATLGGDELCVYGCGTRYTPPADGDRDGATYDKAFDYDRLNAQQKRVWNVMKDGEARTLRQVAEATGDPEASVSARLRDFRKAKFGRHTVRRVRHGGGVWTYRLEPRQKEKT